MLMLPDVVRVTLFVASTPARGTNIELALLTKTLPRTVTLPLTVVLVVKLTAPAPPLDIPILTPAEPMFPAFPGGAELLSKAFKLMLGLISVVPAAV